MKISKRLAVTLAAALLALCVVSAFGVRQLGLSQRRFEAVQRNVIPSIVHLAQLQTVFDRMQIDAYGHFLSSDELDKKRIDGLIAGDDREIAALFAQYAKHDVLDDTDRARLHADEAAFAKYQLQRDLLLDMSRKNDLDDVRAMAFDETSAFGRAVPAMADAIARHVAYDQQYGAALKDENAAAYALALKVQIAVAVIASLFVGVMGALLYGVVKRGLDGMQHAMHRTSASLDLTLRAPVGRMDEIGRTAAAFNELLKRVGGTLREVRGAIDVVSSASQQIAAGNLDLSSRTERQSAALQQTTASMLELTSTVQQNASHAERADVLAREAVAAADGGHELVGRMVETMAAIHANSSKIGEITTLIDSIAFQTNILALNAAVEAARAGEEGRGFAVVAGEVRSLAQRAADAAKQIRALIDVSSATVDAGSGQARDVGQAMTTVKQAIHRVTEIVADIAAASGEQRRGIEQVTQAVTAMDDTTRQNASLVEQAAAAARSLEDQTQRLHGVVGVFRVA